MFDRQLGKVIKYNLDSYEGEEKLYALTSRMARALIASTEYLRWNARHISLPTDLPNVKLLGDWVDNLDERLMLNVNPLENLCAELSGCADEISDIIEDRLDPNNTDGQSLRDKLDAYITNITNNIINKGSPLNPVTVATDSDRKLFGQCVKIVIYTHDVIIDVLEQLEIVSNNTEFLSSAIDSIPMFKFLTDTVPVDQWISDIDYFLSLAKEEFDSGYTVDLPDGDAMGSQWRMACNLYCSCKSDHKITIERVYNAWVNLLSGYTVPDLSNLDEWLSTLAGVNDNSELAVYALYAMFWGIARLSSFFGNIRLSDAAFNLLLKIGEQDTSFDPDDYCSACTSDTWSHDFPDSNVWSAFTLETFGGSTTIVSDNKIKGQTNTGNDAIFLNFKITVEADVQNVSFTIEYNLSSGAEQDFNLYIDGALVESINLAAFTSPHVMSYSPAVTGSHVYEILSGIFGTTSSGRVLNVTASSWGGNGSDPFD